MMTLTESNQTGWRGGGGGDGGEGGQLLWQSFSSALFAQWVQWVAMGGFHTATGRINSNLLKFSLHINDRISCILPCMFYKTIVLGG